SAPPRLGGCRDRRGRAQPSRLAEFDTSTARAASPLSAGACELGKRVRNRACLARTSRTALVIVAWLSWQLLGARGAFACAERGWGWPLLAWAGARARGEAEEPPPRGFDEPG